MSRARSPNPLKEKALKMYKSGKTLADIARELDKPEGTVRRWKYEGKWDADPNIVISNVRNKQSERSKKNIRKQSEKKFEDAVQETLENTELTEKQRWFCVYYVQSRNATQSYINAYKTDYSTSAVNGSKLLRNSKVKEEINKLRAIKKQNLLDGYADIETDIVDLQMRIAMASMGDYITFGKMKVPQWREKDGSFQPVVDPNTGEQKVIKYNTVDLNDSKMVDMQLVKSVKEGKDGITFQLKDGQKAIDWLTNYFEFNPGDKRKADFEAKRLEMEMLRLELSNRDNTQEGEMEDDGFLDSLNETAKVTWENENE